MAGIPLESVSKTLREAVITARGLDIRFLWVDSLCIIQEDMSDWVHEATLMVHTYQGPTPKIAAAEAKDGTEDCFLPRQASSCLVRMPYRGRWGVQRARFYA